MNCSILSIGENNFVSNQDDLEKFAKKNQIKIDFIYESSLEKAYEHLFSGSIGLILLDDRVEGFLEAITMIKQEELTRHTIIAVALFSDKSLESRKKILEAGADQTITNEEIEAGLLVSLMRPLIINVALMDEQREKAAGLQEKTINDFIMLDLIKAYIPKTIWKVALECAHLQKIELPGEERELTIVFGDIKSFTRMSQHLTPKELIQSLNTVYEVVTRHIYEHNGDVDKFIGDAFFGIFESPTDAVRSMVLIQKELEVLNKKREEKGLYAFQFRIGVHTGPVIRGNVGGHNRYDNTLIGNSVNTASRLEHIAPVGEILISEDTRKRAKLKIPMEYQGKELLRGQESETTFYNVYSFLKDNEEFLSSGKKVSIKD